MTTWKPKIYLGLSFQEYTAIPAVNNSFLWTLKTKSPAHALYERQHPSEPTPALLFGQALHALILEPTTWNDRYAVRPECDRRTKEGKAVYEQFAATLAGRQEVKADEYECMEEIATAVRGATCGGLVKGGSNEVVLVWNDAETGALMKARCDCVHDDLWDGDVIVDVKTTASAQEDDFRQSVHRYGYFMQAAIYCAGWEALTGRTPEFTILAVEKTPPYAAAAYPLGPKTLDAGRLAFRTSLLLALECKKAERWPGYNDGEPRFLEMTEYHLGMEGVSRFQEHPEPIYHGGGIPDGQEPDEFDEFMQQVQQ